MSLPGPGPCPLPGPSPSAPQDDVPSFPDEVAFAIMEEQLGRRLEEVFSSISERPVAAASLGQVYKAVLRETGEEVAIKVQRPSVEPTILRDLFIFRWGEGRRRCTVLYWHCTALYRTTECAAFCVPLCRSQWSSARRRARNGTFWSSERGRSQPPPPAHPHST